MFMEGTRCRFSKHSPRFRHLSASERTRDSRERNKEREKNKCNFRSHPREFEKS